MEYDKISDQRLGEPSAVIQKRVEAARQVQRERFTAVNDSTDENNQPPSQDSTTRNADMRLAEVCKSCKLDYTQR